MAVVVDDKGDIKIVDEIKNEFKDLGSGKKTDTISEMDRFIKLLERIDKIINSPLLSRFIAPPGIPQEFYVQPAPAAPTPPQQPATPKKPEPKKEDRAEAMFNSIKTALETIKAQNPNLTVSEMLEMLEKDKESIKKVLGGVKI